MTDPKSMEMAEVEEVVERIYLENLSYDETAAVLNRPRGTINRLQREAILALRAQLLSGDR